VTRSEAELAQTGSRGIEPVRREVKVEATPERAFEVFTSGFDTWWNRGHHLNEADLEAAVIEPRKGGRWYERGVDGSECDWGEVLEWDPPHRLVLSWRISGEFRLESDPANASEVEVTFTPDGDTTVVALEHRFFERHGTTAQAAADGVGAEGGWGDLLGLFADRVAATA
jgi:uncharacterized protein YndB with AHSA1/START domain